MDIKAVLTFWLVARKARVAVGRQLSRDMVIRDMVYQDIVSGLPLWIVFTKTQQWSFASMSYAWLFAQTITRTKFFRASHCQ